MPDLFAMTTATGFNIIDEAGERTLKRIGAGKIITITPHLPRNIAALRKYMMLMDRLWECGLQGHYESPTLMRKAILVELGYCEPVRNIITGEVRMFAQSMAIEDMDDPTFSECFDKTKDLILSKLVPLLDHDGYAPEIDKVLDLLSDDRRAA